MGPLILQILAVLIVSAALFLAARYPLAFGFFAWEFGVSWIPGESYSTHYLRAFKYWTSVCTFGALVVGLAYLMIDRETEFADGFLTFFAPLMLAGGYLHSIGYFALHVYHKRRMTRTTINLAGTAYFASVRGHRMSSGNQIHIELCDSHGAVVGRCVFMVHPEFERYEEFQSKSTDDLLQIALGRLDAGEARWVLQTYHDGGRSLILPLNASMPNNVTQQTQEE